MDQLVEELKASKMFQDRQSPNRATKTFTPPKGLSRPDSLASIQEQPPDKAPSEDQDSETVDGFAVIKDLRIENLQNGEMLTSPFDDKVSFPQSLHNILGPREDIPSLCVDGNHVARYHTLQINIVGANAC